MECIAASAPVLYPEETCMGDEYSFNSLFNPKTTALPIILLMSQYKQIDLAAKYEAVTPIIKQKKQTFDYGCNHINAVNRQYERSPNFRPRFQFHPTCFDPYPKIIETSLQQIKPLEFLYNNRKQTTTVTSKTHPCFNNHTKQDI